MTTLLDKDKILEILKRSRYVSDALASVRMMEGVAIDRGDWIPVSERLPEVGEHPYYVNPECSLYESNVVLVYGKTRDGVEDYGIAQCIYDGMSDSGSWSGYMGDWEADACEITAWQPLPEPYKGGED